ncbi:HrpB1 family type III secretion system apparatus protein [Aquabacterium sp. A7-Y]|uniref:HrpB1 family type III secretion system apparatus protein n=1 Tax=Aquabacterium sp. A7-Y TaxID=1349605 RepID=UPI00223D737C|nr:HrpB1 family type III secretion system apparatus protein [Aquabacterium sp. A7-Y]MCW7540283.1 HrpB1 family type III secretion system apparatus protein [Aquabacterium sp. A7-Y]
MDARFQRKDFVAGLVEIISQGISNNRLEDAEAVLCAARALRPRLAELDTFDAWIAIKRGFWPDAIRLLRNLDATASNWGLGKALLAFCQFATGDAAWSISAHEVLQNSQNAEAVGLVKLLLNQEDTPADPAPESTLAAGQPPVSQAAYLRA